MSVEALMRQPDFPFAQFLGDRRQYEFSRKFWQKSFEKGINKTAKRQDWSSWMANPFFDGMPIWSIINRRLGRGISVQQVERSADPIWFKCWVNETDIDSTKNLPYLFVETFICSSSHELFSRLVIEWTDENIGVSTFSRLADEIQSNATLQGAGSDKL